ncbi:hypothetical protein GHT06_004412 [Daphnia sinensis]|uniref:Uncharacterized protein n=1 Tax=Daphnia sinensis TaxID=1820382 RepID=A0AAD5KVH2_9CRUS|nr:hypothetical protein GHT06_004412 [Daphnia sinensis]
MAAKWLNSVDVDFGLQFPRLTIFGKYTLLAGVLYPVLATWMIVRMTLTKNIPSYITIGSYRAMLHCPTLRRNKEPTTVQKPGNNMTKKTETTLEKPVTIPLDVEPMVSKDLLERGLQGSLSGGTPNLEISPTEQPVKSTDNPPRQTPPAQMIVPETQPDDSEPMTISMEPMEPNLGEVDAMETDKTSDHLKAPPTVPQNKRFKPTLTPQNSRPTLSTSHTKKPLK